MVNLVNWTWSTSLRLFFLRCFIQQHWDLPTCSLPRSQRHAAMVSPPRPARRPGFSRAAELGGRPLGPQRESRSRTAAESGIYMYMYLQRWSIVYVKTVGIAWYRMHLHTYGVIICNMTIVSSDTHTFSVAQSFHKWNHRRVKLCIFWGSGRIFKIFQRCLGPQNPGPAWYWLGNLLMGIMEVVGCEWEHHLPSGKHTKNTKKLLKIALLVRWLFH